MDEIPTIKRVDDNLIMTEKSTVLIKPDTQKYLTNIAQQQILQNVYKPPVMDFKFRNPHERTEQLLEEANNKHDKQIELLEKSNAELQQQLNDAYIQLKQLNDKESSQRLELKELRADLKEETLKREIAETKLNVRDWKTAFIALSSALFVLAVEHWKGIYDFILSLIGLQQ